MSSLLERQTTRLIIRPLALADHGVWRDGFLSHKRRKNRWDYRVRAPSELGPAAFRRLVEEQHEQRSRDGNYFLGVFLREDASLVGEVSLLDVRRGNFQNAYLGYRLFRRYWGRGLAREAVAAMLDIGFFDLNLHRIEAGIEAENLASVRVARAVGMRRESLSRKRFLIGGRWVDFVSYVRFCEDVGLRWRARPRAEGPRGYSGKAKLRPARSAPPKVRSGARSLK